MRYQNGKWFFLDTGGTKMTAKERVWAAFRHKEADRVPVGEMHIMMLASSEILGREAITGDGGGRRYMEMKLLSQNRRAEYIERISVDTNDLVKESGIDVYCTILDPPKGGIIYKDITDSNWTQVDEETGAWSKFVYIPENDTTHEIDSIEKQGDNYDAIAVHLDAMEQRGYKIDDSRVESTKYLIDHAGRDIFVMAKVPDLVPSYRSWYAKFMEMMYGDPDLTQRLCDVYVKYGLAVVEKYKEIGVDCVMIGTDWAANNGPIYSPAFIRQYLIPQIQAICKYCHENNMLVLKHTDGNIMQFADDFFAMGIDGYQSVDPGAGMDIGLVKEKYGAKVLLMGNVDCPRTLSFGTPEDVIEETKRVMRKAAKGGGLIVSSSNTICYPIRARNFLTMVETVHKYGNYPLSI
jgi:uroporphyrinogen decarboxylase